MRRPVKQILAVLCALSLCVVATAATGRHVIPSGQEELIRSLLNIEPKEAGGWWFKTASVPGTEIVAEFQLLEEDDPRMVDPSRPVPEEIIERSGGQSMTLRLVHPRSTSSAIVTTERFAILSAEEPGTATLPAPLIEALVEAIRRSEDAFLWSVVAGRSSGDRSRRGAASVERAGRLRDSNVPFSRFFATVSGRWAFSAAFVAVALGLVAAGHRLYALRRRRRGTTD